LRDGEAASDNPTLVPAKPNQADLGFEKRRPGHGAIPAKVADFSRSATRCCSERESRRRLEFFGEGEGGGEDSGFVCSRRSLVLDGDRKFHVVRVRVPSTL